MKITDASLAFIVSVCCVAAASAETATTAASESASGGLDEIIVTAQRTESNLQNTPIAVTAISGADLARSGATSLLDLGSYVPNLSVGSRSTAGATRGGFTIRGMGVDAPASSPAVGIYVDDVYYPTDTGNLLGLFDIDRIEVLRGPQGTLFGRNTIAGAVQYVSVKPTTQEVSGYFTVTGGQNNRQQYAAAVNLPVSDTFAVRVAGQYNREGGFVTDDASGTKRGGDINKQGRIQARWTPVDGLSVDFKIEMLRQITDGRAIAVLGVDPMGAFPFISSAPLTAPPPFPSLSSILGPAQAGFFGAVRPNPETSPLDNRYLTTSRYHFAGYNAPDGLDFKFRTFQNVISYRLNDELVLKSISAYSFTESNDNTDYDNTPLSIYGATRDDRTKLFTQELQLSGKQFDNRLKWTTGLYYYNSKLDYLDQFVQYGIDGVPVPQNGGDTQLKTVSKAVYGQGSFNFTDQLALTLGLRYSREEETGSYLNSQVPGVFVPPFTPAPVTLPTPAFAPQEASFNNVSPEAGFDFQLDPDTLLYIKASRGFRAGGFTVSSQLPLGFLPFGPETAWTYEIGSRMEFLNHRLRVNPTVFYTDWKNIQFNQILVLPSGVVPATRNAGKAKIKGAELESQFALTDRWILTGSASVLNAHYSYIAPGIDVNEGSDLQRSPKSKFALGSNYTYPLSNGSKLIGSVDYAWTATQRSAVAESDYITIASYGLLNGRLQYDLPDGKWSFSVYGTNLTNKYYYIGGINGSTSFGTTEADLGRPREVGGTVSVHF